MASERAERFIAAARARGKVPPGLLPLPSALRDLLDEIDERIIVEIGRDGKLQVGTAGVGSIGRAVEQTLRILDPTSRSPSRHPGPSISIP